MANPLGAHVTATGERPAADRQPSKRRRSKPTRWAARTLFSVAAVSAIQFVHAPEAPRAPFAMLSVAPSAWASPNAFGASQELKLRFSLPARDVEFPLAVEGDPSALEYQWVPLTDTVPAAAPRPLAATLVAPDHAGFYQLLLLRHQPGQTAPTQLRMTEPTLAVMVPFAAKTGSFLNGYRIGAYLAERFSGRREQPAGFLEVQPTDLGLRVSKHFQLSDFLTHDSQTEVWPKYLALDPRLLDKLELVVAQVARTRHVSQDSVFAVDVHSGFRTPAHNAHVLRAARDSRHQYGDAADIVIDANGDGKITSADDRLIAIAVDSVEQAHPELIGGLGLYTSARYRTPYVHIDARGTRSRWRG